MDRSMLMIVGIVFAVMVVGLLTVIDIKPGDVTGMVVSDDSIQACDACSGEPVCATKGDWAADYPSACAAKCDGAKVIYQDICEAIPRAN